MLNYKQKFNQIKCFIFDVDGVLTDGSVVLMPTGNLSRTMHTKDGYAMQLAIKKGYKIVIITGGKDPMVVQRLKDLGITDFYTNSHNKLDDFNELILTYNIIPENVLYMGDDVPDYEVMLRVGLATCPHDAVSEIRSISHYISPIDGGKGCVRDVIEQTLKAQGNWLENNNLQTQSL